MPGSIRQFVHWQAPVGSTYSAELERILELSLTGKCRVVASGHVRIVSAPGASAGE